MIICCGEALIDMIRMQIPGSGEAFMPFCGGGPYNTAVAIGRLKVPVKFLGRFSGDFFGELLLKRLRGNNVGDEMIIRSRENTTLAFVKAERGKEPQYIFYSEGCADRSLEVKDLPPKLPPDTRCIMFGSIAMTMEPVSSAIGALIQREGTRKSAAEMDGAPVISFDPNIRPRMITNFNAYIESFEKWTASSTIVKISSADFAFLYPKLTSDEALQKIISMGPRLAVCTLGSKGAAALLRRNDGNVIRVAAPAVNLPVVDTIGAGDTFHGAFLSWLEIKGRMSRSALVNLSGEELYDALFFANRAASLVCSRRGAEAPTLKEVESLKSAVPAVGKASGAKKPPIKAPAPKTFPVAEKPASKKNAAKPKAGDGDGEKKAAGKETGAQKKRALKP